MAQNAAALRFQIYTAPPSTVVVGSFVDLTCQAPEARNVTIQNRDGAVALLVATDASGSGISVPANGSFTIQLSQFPEAASSWKAGDYICSLKGGVTTQPTIIYTI